MPALAFRRIRALGRLLGPGDPFALKAGDRLGRFEILEILPPGGMGVAYRGHDPVLRRDVVLKVLRPAPRLPAQDRARFLREARLASRAAHPHIVTIFDLQRTGRHDVLVMEYVGARSLKRVILDGPLDASTTLTYARQIVAGLAHLHGLGIIHRDLKPSNLVLSTAGEIKIVDFGIARLVPRPDTPTRSRSQDSETAVPEGVVGTPCYMAPEQFQDRPVDGRTDLFAFGCVLFEMLTGQVAFDSTSWENVRRRILHGEPEWPRERFGDARDRLRPIVEKCLRKDPGERWESAAELEAALFAVRLHVEDPEEEGIARLWRDLLVAKTSTALEDLHARVGLALRRDPDNLELRRLLGRVERTMAPAGFPREALQEAPRETKVTRRALRPIAGAAALVALILVATWSVRVHLAESPPAPTVVAGRVVGPDGRPVWGARVTIDGHHFLTRTTTEGAFHALAPDVQPGELIHLRVSHDSLRTYTRILRADSVSLDALRVEMTGLGDE